MRDLVEEEFQVAGVADSLGYLCDCLGVIMSEYLDCEIAEVTHI